MVNKNKNNNMHNYLMNNKKKNVHKFTEQFASIYYIKNITLLDIAKT